MCPFCERVLPDADSHVASTESSVAFLDAYPSAPGHTLVIPRRHVGFLAELTPAEHADLFSLVHRILVDGDVAGAPARTVGVNDGFLAGQTVPHVHVHIIPRRDGDVADPRGGVRWVLPRSAAYWNEPS